MRKIGLFCVIVLVFAGPAVAQMMGYSVDTETKVVTSFFCDEHGDLDCFKNRTELGTIDVWTPWATSLAPTGEMVVADSNVWGISEPRLVWFELPSLEVQSSLVLDETIGWIDDIAFGPDSSLWVISGTLLYEVDSTTGEATEVHEFDSYVNTFTWVGSRMYFGAEGTLLEFDPATGTERVVADYHTQWGYLFMASLSSYDDCLWSVGGEVSLGPQVPYTLIEFGIHDLPDGNWNPLLIDFDVLDGPTNFSITIDLVNQPEGLPGIPASGILGGGLMIALIALSGLLVARSRT